MNRPMQISRRACLRGAGVALTLPWLEAMLPSTTHAGGGGLPKRLLMWVMCGGAHQPAWEIGGTGPGYTVGQTLSPLAEAGILADATIVTGGHNDFADGGAGHGPGCGALLTGVEASKSEIRAGVSMDQLVANSVGQTTPISSLQLGTAPPVTVTADGYPPSYNHLFSWADETTQLPNLIEPLKIFERIAGAKTVPVGDSSAELSVLDAVLEDGRRLESRLGSRDKQRLDQYQSQLRDIEKRLTQGPSSVACEPGAPPAAGIPGSFDEHLDLIDDLIQLAFTCDITRVITMVYDSSAPFTSYDFLGAPGSYHLTYAHHMNSPDKIAGYSAVNRWMVERYVRLVSKLASSEDIDGSRLLDNCGAVLCSEHGEGNGHRTVDLPCIISGSMGGSLVSGEHIALGSEPMANIHIALMKGMGLDIDEFGMQGTRAAPGLLA